MTNSLVRSRARFESFESFQSLQMFHSFHSSLSSQSVAVLSIIDAANDNAVRHEEHLMCDNAVHNVTYTCARIIYGVIGAICRAVDRRLYRGIRKHQRNISTTSSHCTRNVCIISFHRLLSSYNHKYAYDRLDIYININTSCNGDVGECFFI